MRYTEIYFTDLSTETTELLIAVLPDFGFSGMEELANGLKAYASEPEANLDGLAIFADQHSLVFSTASIEEQNWNAQWESNFDPVVIPGKIHVRAHFHPAIEGIEHEILITPKMSFGTGHHATTAMMMKAMLELDFTNQRVIDFGTGTGILAILAEKLGALSVDAIDNDEWSINNARENAINNNSPNLRIELLDSLETLPPAELVLANINKSVLLENVNSLFQKVLPTGFLILSGLLSEDYDDITEAYFSSFGHPIRKYAENGWIAIVFQNTV